MAGETDAATGAGGTVAVPGHDYSRWEQPPADPDLRVNLLAWLDYQRHEFQRKWRDLTPEQLAQWSIPPVELSVLGLIRHMQGGARLPHLGSKWW